MFFKQKICRAGSSSDKLGQEEQTATKATGNWENEEWMVVEKESTGECIKEAPNGAEVLKNILALALKGRRDIGRKSLGTCGSREGGSDS